MAWRGHGGERDRDGEGERRDGEGLLLALVGTVAVEDDGPALLVLVRHQAGVLEVGYQRRLALDPGIRDLALLLRVELLPLLVVELLVKGDQRSKKKNKKEEGERSAPREV